MATSHVIEITCQIAIGTFSQQRLKLHAIAVKH